MYSEHNILKESHNICDDVEVYSYDDVVRFRVDNSIQIITRKKAQELAQQLFKELYRQRPDEHPEFWDYWVVAG